MVKKLQFIFNIKTFKTILYICIILGIYLAIEQFIFNRNLWHDELALAINIRDRSFLELLQPLSDNQSAPIGFLYIEKIMLTLFGNYDYVLRVVPLSSFILSIPLFYILSSRLLEDKLPSLLATAMFSTSLTFIMYSDEVKQYSSDILFTLVIFYLTIKLDFNKTKSIILYAISGSIIIWFTNVSIIILFISGLYVLYIHLYKKNNIKILFIFFLWLFSFAIYYYFFIYNHPTTAFMKECWQDKFLPTNIFSSHFYVILFENIKEIYVDLLVMGNFWIYALIITLFSTIIAIQKKQFVLLLFFIGPIITHLILSAMELYPFYARFILYLLPLFILMFTYGVYNLYLLIQNYSSKASYIFLIISVYLTYIYITPTIKKIPFSHEEITDSLSYIQEHIETNDSIYLYYASVPSFLFYIDKKLDNHKVIIGKEYREDYKKYYEELEQLTGRTWLLFKHVYGFEEQQMIDFLINKKGAKILDAKWLSKGAALYYFDINKSIKNSIRISDRKDVQFNLLDLQERIVQNDSIYIYYAAKEAFSYYKDPSLNNYNIILGTEHRQDYTKYNEELKQLKGKTWLFFQHFYRDEEKYMTDFLTNTKDAKLLYTKRQHNGSIYYFDIK